MSSYEEKEMIKAMEMHNSINTCSSMLLFFCDNLSFWVKNEIFTISESEIRKNKLKKNY